MKQRTDENIIRAVIVDDERLAIKGMELLLADYPSIEIVGAADSVENAEDVIKETRPDLVFLDIQLQGENGFDLLDKLVTDSKVVFVTAYDEYAIRAFEVNALDYLLKPVSSERFKSTISRLFDKDKTALKNEKAYNYSDLVSLNTGGTFQFIKASNIVSIRAVGDYSKVSTIDGKNKLVYRTLKDWETRLPGDYFIRVHRSAIVNMAHIDYVEPTTSNRFVIYLHHTTSPVFMSQRYSALFRKLHRTHTPNLND